MGSNILDSRGQNVHYSDDWIPVTFGGSDFTPGKPFRIYTENAITLVLKGYAMKEENAIAIGLTEGYHNFVCDKIIESGSDAPDGVFALF